ncbi:MAG TPA: MMPL family transporter [Gaiellaceae bacterium]
MSGAVQGENLAARAGRWSARHWKTAVFGWLGFVVVAFALGNMVGTNSLSANEPGPGESGRVQQILNDEFAQPAKELVLVQSSSLTATSPEFRAAVQDVTQRLRAQQNVTNVSSPFAPGNAGRISSDGHSALVQFDIRGKSEDAQDKVGPILAAVASAQDARPQFTIEEFGGGSVSKGINEQFGKDLLKAGALSLPVTLGILLLTFGALVAAGIPLLLALTSVFAAIGLLALPSHVLPMDDAVNAVVLLIGLAVGVDYSMFYLKREREERAAGKPEGASVEAAAATSGRSVLISGFTVLVAMAGMFISGDKTFEGFAAATMLVVATSVLGSLTVLPAVLSKLGDRVNKGRVPFLRSPDQRVGESRFWNAVLGPVLRRPLLFGSLAAGFLILLAVPALRLVTTQNSIESYPRSLAVIRTYDKIQQAFPGDALAAQVLVQAPDVRSGAVRSAIGELERKALASGEMFTPIEVDVNNAGTVALVSIPIAGNGTNSASKRAVHRLRDDLVPATVGTLPDTTTGVGGMTAQSIDFEQQFRQRTPFVFAFVFALTFVLMLLAFRSIVIGLKAIVLNSLSVAAAYGILVLVFQDGIGRGLIGASSGGIESFMPMFLFVILFGLSMDYHVFIISRIREGFDQGMSTDEAVEHGIKTTAGVVTSAAIVMVLVFSVFITLSFDLLKQFGVGLAAAVLIDATIIRAVLLPASMKLLGDWNWYLPSWLEWLPRVAVASETEPVVEAPPAVAGR